MDYTTFEKIYRFMLHTPFSGSPSADVSSRSLVSLWSWRRWCPAFCANGADPPDEPKKTQGGNDGGPRPEDGSSQ